MQKIEDVDKVTVKISYLNQSYIFHLIAFWQVFIEDLLDYSLHLLRKKNFDEVMCKLLENSFKAKLRRFNTPSCANIDQLFKDTLGIEKISNSWNVLDGIQQLPKDLLKELLIARHQIAHTGKTNSLLEFNKNFEQMTALFKMAELMENELTEYISKLTKN